MFGYEKKSENYWAIAGAVMFVIIFVSFFMEFTGGEM